MQKTTPCLWFDTQAEEAVQHCSAIFASARTLRTTYFGEGTHRPADLVLMGMHKIDIVALQRAHAQA